MGQVLGRLHAEQDVDIAEPKVGVEQHDVLALLGQPDGEVHRHVGLADAALAAGDGDDANPGGLHDTAQSGSLVHDSLSSEHGPSFPQQRKPRGRAPISL